MINADKYNVKNADKYNIPGNGRLREMKMNQYVMYYAILVKS